MPEQSINRMLFLQEKKTKKKTCFSGHIHQAHCKCILVLNEQFLGLQKKRGDIFNPLTLFMGLSWKQIEWPSGVLRPGWSLGFTRLMPADGCGCWLSAASLPGPPQRYPGCSSEHQRVQLSWCAMNDRVHLAFCCRVSLHVTTVSRNITSMPPCCLLRWGTILEGEQGVRDSWPITSVPEAQLLRYNTVKPDVM